MGSEPLFPDETGPRGFVLALPVFPASSLKRSPSLVQGLSLPRTSAPSFAFSLGSQAHPAVPVSAGTNLTTNNSVCNGDRGMRC